MYEYERLGTLVNDYVRKGTSKNPCESGKM
jgi:hypothetical protein